LTDSRTGQAYIADDNGVYSTDNTRLNRAGDSYFGTDGSIYEQQGDILIQVGGPKQNEMGQSQRIEIPIPSSNPERGPSRSGAINPSTGEYLVPSGDGGYIGTRDGHFYVPAGPHGAIDTRTGRFIPTN
jgi:hypothetical protein